MNNSPQLVSGADRFRCVHRAVYPLLERQSRALRRRPLRVLVVPATEIQIPLLWAQRLRAMGREIELTMVDCPRADDDVEARERAELDHDAREEAARGGFVIEYLHVGRLPTPLPSGFDLVVSLHFMHRLRRDQVFRQLQFMIAATSGPLIVCDYARSVPNLWLAKLGCRAMLHGPAARQATIDSIRNAYSRQEFQQLAEQALARPVKMESLFPYHFAMSCEEQTISEPVPAFA